MWCWIWRLGGRVVSSLKMWGKCSRTEMMMGGVGKEFGGEDEGGWAGEVVI